MMRQQTVLEEQRLQWSHWQHHEPHIRVIIIHQVNCCSATLIVTFVVSSFKICVHFDLTHLTCEVNLHYSLSDWVRIVSTDSDYWKMITFRSFFMSIIDLVWEYACWDNRCHAWSFGWSRALIVGRLLGQNYYGTPQGHCVQATK